MSPNGSQPVLRASRPGHCGGDDTFVTPPIVEGGLLHSDSSDFTDKFIVGSNMLTVEPFFFFSPFLAVYNLYDMQTATPDEATSSQRIVSLV